ncbi:Mitochondrial distribution and morphology protein 31, mitochondrial precursor [Coemansia sp. S146]|nr:Mitochondrial distribution and morphology protein 31, mitochondrial precursor [Coemansia sp. S146]
MGKCDQLDAPSATTNEALHMEAALEDQPEKNSAYPPAELTPADSGYAWVIVICAALNLMCTLGVVNSFGVFSTYYINYIYPSVSAASIAWVGTTMSLFMLGGAITTGPLTDRFGFRLVSLAGTVICCVALLLASFTSALWQLVLTQGIMFGIGAACIFSPSVSLPAQWHEKRRPLATGIAVAGSGAGGMIFTVATQKMMDTIGHKWTLRTLALILLCVSGTAGMFYKRRVSVPRGGINLGAIARDPRLIAIGLAGFMVNVSYFVPWFYLPTAALKIGQTKQAANNLILYMNAGSTVGRILAAYAAMLLGPINSIAIAYVICSVLVLVVMLAVKSMTGYIILAVIYGGLSASFISITPLVLTNIFGTQAVTTAMGIMNMWCAIGKMGVIEEPSVAKALAIVPDDQMQATQSEMVRPGALAALGSLHTDSESNKDPLCGMCGRAAPTGDVQHRQLRDSRVMPSDPSSRLRIAAPNDPKALPEPSFDPLYFYHYGSRQEILREITGFFPRLRARLRRALKGSYQKRPWTIDDVFALATWVIMSQAMLLLIGTTTTVSVILWTLNRLQYQDWIARKLSDWVSSALGVAVSFESAIVPAWRRGAIRLKNVKIYCGPEHGSLLDGRDRDTNFTNYKLQIDQIDVTLSLWRWMDDRGLIRECAMRGVRGVVDRRPVWWDPEITYSPSESRRARLPGVFDLDSLDIEDMLLTVHPWQNFRPITVSIYSASLPRFRDRWMLYDALNANSIVGMYDGSLFTIHQAHQHLHPHSLAMHTAGLYGYDGQPKGDQRAEGAESEAEARTTHVQVEGLNIDHINSGVDGPVGWITSGRLNVSALVNFPTQPSATDPAMAIRKIVDNINDSIDVVILPSMPDWSNPEKSPNSLVRALYHLDMVDSSLAQEMHDRLKRRAERESQRRLEKQRQRTASWSQPLAPIPSHLIGGVLQHTVKPTAHADAHSIETLPRALEDPTAVHVDLQVEFNDIRASVPLSMPALGYPLLSAVLVRPIVAYMNAHRTSLPMRCQLRLRLDDFDGAWSFWDSGADSLITQGIGAAFAQLVQNERERNRRLKLVGWWSVTAIARQCARLADFVYSQRSFFSYLGVAPETDRI